jgi:hypothetical protein
MIVKIKYDLPDERSDAMIAMNASTLSAAISDVDNHCRNLIKHGDPSLDGATPETVAAVNDLAERIRFMLRDALGSMSDDVL